MARVSIIMPTFNRADTILRAVESVRAQRFQDWELIVIDDGSTDDTRDRLVGLDPRLRVVAQENQGVGAARNRGLREARGELIAFLDSDDAWEPHHLELAAAFFGAHAEEHLYSSEFWEDFGEGAIVKHWRVEVSTWYPATAAEIGSKDFARPPPLGDGYLRVYSTRAEVGEWGRGVVERSGHRDVFHYRGDIFERWRWGWLMALQPTVITRRALEAVGPFDTSIPVANDFSWLALLCERFTANFFSIPGAIKHELGHGGRSLSEDHLVTGKTAVRFHQDVLRLHEELFWSRRPDDPELAGIRGFRQYLVAEAAARQGQRDVALEYLRRSSQTYRGKEARKLRWVLELAPSPELARRAYALSLLPGRIRSRLSRLWASNSSQRTP
jgi:glycosyltransferase involved in cell wall biosynthesis